MGLRIQIFLLSISIQFLVATAQTNPQDLAALKNLKEAWTNIALNWDGLDPCGSSWVGIQCNNSRITAIILPSMGLIGQLPGDIGQLLELQMLFRIQGSLIQQRFDRTSYSNWKFDEVNIPSTGQLQLQWSHSRHDRVPAAAVLSVRIWTLAFMALNLGKLSSGICLGPACK
ncbi:hypothetical protein RHSIM_Rhsim11G0113200 [Rhododendron simsii]|uniref:Leucine-rich repeat-containing N-terminal plant-type domain-containing protein n=1 Tax=Rhododendron simsii TaxID=118357 RepID=A0A834L8G8_RHOSS|nr:hypothetical protein RHSIM_Rhsim11G0113200 [Rhododendron simsii]